jgi:hypothetical protein
MGRAWLLERVLIALAGSMTLLSVLFAILAGRLLLEHVEIDRRFRP